MANRNTNDLNDASVLAAALANNRSTDDLQRRLAELLVKKLEEEQKREEEKRAQLLALKRQGAIAMEQRRKQEEAEQANCPHMKPWGGPAIAGQRDHQGDYHFICLYCNKTWINNELPAHLRIPEQFVGGPV